MFHTFFEEKMLLSYKINFKNKLTRNFIYHCQDFEKLFRACYFTVTEWLKQLTLLNFGF